MRFQAGGTLQEGHFYIERDADEELLRALRGGAYCHVLAPRQIGKSSLCRRAERRLRASGAHSLSFAMSALGTESSAEDWYFTVVDKLAGGLGLADPLPFWEGHGRLTVVERWSRYLREELLRLPGEIYLFLDEIDALRDLRQFRPDDFFGSLRELYNDRAPHPDYGRLRVCLVGTAAPTELMRTGMTPFNVSRGVRLRDFSWEQVRGLLPGLAGVAKDPEELLKEVFAWTDGHPYMTQRLCEALATAPEEERYELAGPRVKGLVKALFLQQGPRSDPNLEEAQRRFDLELQDAPLPEKMALYQRLLLGEAVSVDFGQRTQEELLLGGMIKEAPERPGSLRIRNRVFARAFGQEWLRERETDRYFADSMSRWLVADRPNDRLLQGRELERAEQWARDKQLNELEKEYLVKSRGRWRERGIMRAVMVGALLTSAVLGGLLIWTGELLRQKEGLLKEKEELRLRADARHQEALLEKERAAQSKVAAAQAQAQRERAEREKAEADARAASEGEHKAKAEADAAQARAQQARAEAQAERAMAQVADARARQRASERAEARLSAEQHGQEAVRLAQAKQWDHALVEGIRAVAPSLAQQDRVPPWASQGLAAALDSALQEQSPREAHGEPVAALRCARVGGRFTSVGSDGTALQWEGPGRFGRRVAPPPAEPVVEVARPLWELARLGHEGPVTQVAVHGGYLVSGGKDGRAQLWRDGQWAQPLRGHGGPVNVVVFSPDGAQVLTASDDGTALLWDVREGQISARLEGHGGPVTAACFVEGGRFVVTGGQDGRVRVFMHRPADLMRLACRREVLLSPAQRRDVEELCRGYGERGS